MGKKTTSATSRTKSNAARRPKGGTSLGRALIAAAEETLAHVRGEIQLESYTLPVQWTSRLSDGAPEFRRRNLRSNLR